MERSTWSPNSVHVQRLLKFIRKKGAVTPQMLVEFDGKNGRKLFTWDDEAAGEQWRAHEARMFLNTFRMLKDGIRIRAVINLPATEETGLEERAYYSVEEIADEPSLRAWVIADIVRRAKSLAAELRLWKLDREEQEEFFKAMRDAMERKVEAKVA